MAAFHPFGRVGSKVTAPNGLLQAVISCCRVVYMQWLAESRYNSYKSSSSYM